MFLSIKYQFLLQSGTILSAKPFCLCTSSHHFHTLCSDPLNSLKGKHIWNLLLLVHRADIQHMVDSYIHLKIQVYLTTVNPNLGLTRIPLCKQVLVQCIVVIKRFKVYSFKLNYVKRVLRLVTYHIFPAWLQQLEMQSYTRFVSLHIHSGTFYHHYHKQGS